MKPLPFLIKINIYVTSFVEKAAQKYGHTSAIFQKKLPKVGTCLKGYNSPNLFVHPVGQ
jgi:hypothetical protein